MKSETEKGEKSVTNFRLSLIAIVGQCKRKNAFCGITDWIYSWDLLLQRCRLMNIGLGIRKAKQKIKNIEGIIWCIIAGDEINRIC